MGGIFHRYPFPRAAVPKSLLDLHTAILGIFLIRDVSRTCHECVTNYELETGAPVPRSIRYPMRLCTSPYASCPSYRIGLDFNTCENDEILAFNPKVAGSTPARPTIEIPVQSCGQICLICVISRSSENLREPLARFCRKKRARVSRKFFAARTNAVFGQSTGPRRPLV